jgi:hypothetical protein
MLMQMFILHPLAAPVWSAGLVLLLRDPESKGWRVLGITYVVIMACMLVLHGRMYYPGPAYPMLFAAGGVAIDGLMSRLEGGRWLKPAYITVLVVTGVMLAPFAYFPLMSVNQYMAYSKFMHLQPVRLENHAMGPLPQIYADQFGWKEMAQVVADAYHKLPPDEQKSCGIFGQNYGQAGAIDFFGRKMGLPPAMSGHQNYFYWGPRGFSGQCLMVMGDTPERLGELFERVEKVRTVGEPSAFDAISTFRCVPVPRSEIWNVGEGVAKNQAMGLAVRVVDSLCRGSIRTVGGRCACGFDFFQKAGAAEAAF